MAETTCIICEKHRRPAKEHPGFVAETDHWYVFHAVPMERSPEVYIGHLYLEPKRHIPGVDGLSDEEAREMGLLQARFGRVLKEVLGAEHVYLFVMGHHVPHLHVHLVPRYPGTPREYWGVRVDEWPDAPLGKEPEARETARRLREAWDHQSENKK
jgi:histidine triad (HIT) family protein